MFPLSDSNSSGKIPFWVVLIIIANISVFIAELTASNPDAFVSRYALIPVLVNFSLPSTLLPFLTSQFLHGGFTHILSNMWFLWIFGDNVEGRMGFVKFPVFYLIAGISGGLLQYLVTPTSSLPMLGASGAIAGVLGAYMAWFPHHTVRTLVPFVGFFTTVNLPAMAVLMLWFLTQLFNGSAAIATAASDVGGVAFWAHIGGFASGWLMAKTMRTTQHEAEFVKTTAFGD
jgi:membrane associated rhomboid family serine protease